MVLIDDRDGSRQLSYCSALQGNCQLQRLDHGDVMLSGHGPDESTITVGIEVKSISDLLSSIASKRLQAHQLPGLLNTYNYAWLLVFGNARPGSDNYLEVNRHGRWQHFKLGRHPVPWSYLEGFLLTVQMFTPIRVKWVYNEEEAAKWIMVYDRWLSKKWKLHKGLQGFNESGKQASPFESDPVEKLMAEMAACIPSVGWTRGWSAAKHFQSVEEMINAPASEWEKLPKFGPVFSKAVRTAIRRKK